MDNQRRDAYLRVVKALDQERGLRPRERDILLDSAEGLFLDDSDSDYLLNQATKQLSILVTSDRWMPDEAEELLDLLEECSSSESDDELV